MVNFPRRIFNRPLDRELGFGKHLTTEGRMMNPDGSFNVERERLGRWDNVYFKLVTMSWTAFLLLVLGSFLGLNLVFVGMYAWIGTDQLTGIPSGGFWDTFFNPSPGLAPAVGGL